MKFFFLVFFLQVEGGILSTVSPETLLSYTTVTITVSIGFFRKSSTEKFFKEFTKMNRDGLIFTGRNFRAEKRVRPLLSTL